jgi:hypothetical protein
MRKSTLLVALLVAGCPPSSDGGAGAGAEWACEPATGTWRFSYERNDGDCVNFADEIISFDLDEEMNTMVGDPACNIQAEGDACDDGRTIMAVCDTLPDNVTPGLTERTIFLRRDSESEMTGVLQMYLYDYRGVHICGGTYNITATRL